MTVLEIPGYTDISLDYGDVLNQIIYNDDSMLVVLTDTDLINSTLNTSIVSYYKKSNQEYEKICDLGVPRSPLSSAPVSYTRNAKNLNEELDETFLLNMNQNQHYSVINWADEVSYEEATNIPNWALIPGVDFDRHAKNDSSSTENIDDFNQLHHQYIINWAEEPVYGGPVDVPDWAFIPGLDFNRHAKDDSSRRHWATTENIDGVCHIHHQYVINWADEPIIDGHIDVPDWALIPDFKFNVTPKISHEGFTPVTDLDSDAKDCVNWADDISEDEAVDVPEWAMDRNLYFNRQRINAKSYFRDVVSGLSTVWE